MKYAIIVLGFTVLWSVMFGVMESILHIESHGLYAVVGGILGALEIAVFSIWDR